MIRAPGLDFGVSLTGASSAIGLGTLTPGMSAMPRGVCFIRDDGYFGGGGGGGGMSLQLVMRPVQTVAMRQQLGLVLEPRLRDNFYEAVDYWTHSKHFAAEFPRKADAPDEKVEVEYTFAPPEWISSISAGEKIGCYFGDMMFISSRLLEEHPSWVPFIIVKLYGERFVDDGLDLTGRQKHYDALFRTIRLAAGLMETPELVKFLEHLKAHERSGYFKWDEEADRFLAGHGSAAEAKRAYLQRHHKNMWVTRGRNEEAIADVSPLLDCGFRIHAEAAARDLRSEGVGFVYSAAHFVRDMLDTPYREGERFVIGGEISRIAYLLSLESGGIVDLIRFVDERGIPGAGPRDCAIMRTPGKRSTWVALGKRLSYTIMGIETRVHTLAERERKRLEGLVVDLKALNDSTAAGIAEARALMLSQGRDAAAALVRRLTDAYPQRTAEIQAEADRAGENLRALEDLEAQLNGLV